MAPFQVVMFEHQMSLDCNRGFITPQLPVGGLVLLYVSLYFPRCHSMIRGRRCPVASPSRTGNACYDLGHADYLRLLLRQLPRHALSQLSLPSHLRKHCRIKSLDVFHSILAGQWASTKQIPWKEWRSMFLGCFGETCLLRSGLNVLIFSYNAEYDERNNSLSFGR